MESWYSSICDVSVANPSILRSHFCLLSLSTVVGVLGRLAGYHPFDPEGDAEEKVLQENIKMCKYDFDDPEWDQVR